MVVINFSKKSYNLILSIPPLPYKSHPKTPFADIANIPVYFSNKFGKPENTIFVMGDYDKGDYHMKGLEPVICKKFRRIFKNAGYKTFLVNEFRTSKLCNCCHNELEHFLERPSQKPKYKKENKTEICHGLLRCQSVKHNCEIIHNRDKNAVQNMLNIVSSVLNTGKRPDAFCRAINS